MEVVVEFRVFVPERLRIAYDPVELAGIMVETARASAEEIPSLADRLKARLGDGADVKVFLWQVRECV